MKLWTGSEDQRRWEYREGRKLIASAELLDSGHWRVLAGGRVWTKHAPDLPHAIALALLVLQ